MHQTSITETKMFDAFITTLINMPEFTMLILILQDKPQDSLFTIRQEKQGGVYPKILMILAINLVLMVVLPIVQILTTPLCMMVYV